MNKFGSAMESFGRKVILILFGMIVFFLAISSMFGSSFVNHDEYTFFVSDVPIIHLGVFFSIIIIIIFVRNKISYKFQQKTKKIMWYAFLVIYVLGFAALAIYLSLEPRADQKSIVDTAKAMVAGNFDAYKKGGYMYVYPNQIGIVFFLYCIFKFFTTSKNIICILNAIAVGVTAVASNEIANELKQEKETKSYKAGILTLLFIPIGFYVPFIYGNLMGMALSMLSIWFTMKYYNLRKYSHIWLAVITAVIAMLLKQNFLIPLVGIIVFVLWDIVKQKSKKSVVFLLSLIVVSISLSTALNVTVESITGEKVSQGVPSLAWVVMGMQEGYMAYGWHNQYNENVFRNNDCDNEKTKEVVKRDFYDRINEMATKPAYTVKFYFQKTISQWNNPTFECFWINDTVKRTEDGIKVKHVSNVFHGVTGEPANKLLQNYCNIYQSIVLLLTCFWLFFEYKKISFDQLLLPIIFLGGFIFHLFWEAKCQYVIPYFVLLFPYAIKGLNCFVMSVEKMVIGEPSLTMKEKVQKNKRTAFVIAVLLVIAVSSVIVSPVTKKVFGFTQGAYEQFLVDESER